MPEAGQNILLVDDDDTKRHVIAQVLRRSGFEVIEASNGVEALSRIYEEPGLIILDVKLPDLSGFEVARRLKQTPAAHTPILHLSATFVRDEDRARGLEQGAVGYLTYPVDPVVLVAHARSLLRLGRYEWERERLLRRERDARRLAENSQRRFRVLSDLGRVVSQGLPPDALVDAAFDMLVPAVAEAAAVVRVHERDTGELTVRVRHRDPEREPALRIWCEEGAHQLLAAADTVEADSGGMVAASEHLKTDESGPRGLYLVPMRIGRTLEGALLLKRHSSGTAFTDPLRELYAELGSRLGGALAHAHAYASSRIAQARAEEARATGERFIEEVTRELRQPLTTVASWLRVLARAKLTEDQKAEAVEMLQQSVQDQLELLDELAELSGILTGRLALRRAPMDLRERLDHAVAAFQGAASRVGVTLEQVEAPQPLRIEGDAARLEQLLVAVLRNALEHTEVGGRIEVSTRLEQHLLQVRIQNTGHGIRSEDLERIFEPFWRDLTQMQGPHGLGMSLPVARALAEQHGGSLHAMSDGLGTGATFILRLPRLRTEPHTTRSERPGPETSH